VTAHGAVSDTSVVDVTALARAFQAEIEQWRSRPVTADSSTKAGDSTRSVDSTDDVNSTAGVDSTSATDSTGRAVE